MEDRRWKEDDAHLAPRPCRYLVGRSPVLTHAAAPQAAASREPALRALLVSSEPTVLEQGIKWRPAFRAHAAMPLPLHTLPP